MLTPNDFCWLVLCCLSESNRPEEWPAIAQVIENRRRDIKRFGGTYKGVVLARMQFSAFNDYTSKPTLPDTTKLFYACTKQRWYDPVNAIVCAARLTNLRDDFEMDLFDPGVSKTTYHYYSPVSMHPVGSHPAWLSSAKRIYAIPGIVADRFTFAEGVAI